MCHEPHVEPIFFWYCRLSRDERQFSRHLEQALAASKKTSDSNLSVSDELGDTDGAKASENVSDTTADASSKDDEFIPDQSASSDELKDESFSAVEEEEDEDSDFSASPQPKKAKKKQTKENAKSASKGKRANTKTPTADSVINNDNSLTNSLVKKATRSTAVKCTPAKPLVQKTTRSATVCVAKTTLTAATNRVKSSPASVKSYDSNSSVPRANKRAVNWTPPAKVGEGNMRKTDSVISKPTRVCSGGCTPVIRVGLSRNARVKSLHTNVKT